MILDYSDSHQEIDPIDFTVPNDFDDLVEINILDVLGLQATIGVVGESLQGEPDTITYNFISVISIGVGSPGSLNNSLFNPFIGGGILSDFQPLPEPVSGPFWLYRNAVPEPNSIVLLALGALTVFSTRNRLR